MTIRFDPYDLGAVSLRVGSAWRRLPCRTEGLGGVSWDVWTSTARDLRARFREQALMTRDVVLDAIEAIKAVAAQGEAAVSIDRLAPSVEEVERVERGLLAGFEVPCDAPPEAWPPDASGPIADDVIRDAFGRTFGTGGGTAPPADAPAPGRPPRRRTPLPTATEAAPEDGVVEGRNQAVTDPDDTWIED